jgi:hypothetical protein
MPLTLAETMMYVCIHGSKHISSLNQKTFRKILTDYKHDNVDTKVVGLSVRSRLYNT